MPTLTLIIHVNGNALEFEGEATFDQIGELAGLWFGAILGTAASQERLDALTAKLKAHNDALQTTVTSSTPQN